MCDQLMQPGSLVPKIVGNSSAEKSNSQISSTSSTSKSEVANLRLFGNTTSKKRSADPAPVAQSDKNDADFLVPEPRAKKNRATTHLTVNKTFNFKQKPGKEYWWMPKEAYLRNQVANFTLALTNHDFSIVPYRGEVDSQDAQRKAIALQLENDLELLDDAGVPDMKNGHVMKDNEIHRALVSQAKGSERLTGGIYFSINLDTRICTIHAIEVVEEKRKLGIDSQLMHTAIFTALLYGCDQITIASVHDAIAFYENNGFIYQRQTVIDEKHSKSDDIAADYTLAFANPGSCAKFLDSVSKWTNTRYLKSLINMVNNNAKTLSKNAATLTEMMSASTSFRPKQSDFPLLAYLASYQFRAQKNEAEKEVAAIKAEKAAVAENAVVAETTVSTSVSTKSPAPLLQVANLPDFIERLKLDPVTDADVDEWADGLKPY